MDTGALKKAQPETIRILVWLLSFLSFGYATAEFEVTSERLGVYRPEEHIDNPKDYADNEDATKYDRRLRGLVRPIELEIDHETGMKNYIANAKGDWATSAAFVKYSFTQSIQHGRMYTNGHGFFKGKDEDLAEALRLLGQGLHTLEDFSAHSNYVELSLRNQGFHNVFPHCGTNSQVQIRGKQVFPLVTGTFGVVDFYHSVLGEATDHFTQSEVNEMDNAMQIAQSSAQSSSPLTTLVKLLSKVPGTRDLCAEAENLQRMSNQQSRAIGEPEVAESGWFTGHRGVDDDTFDGTSRAPQPDWSLPQAYNPHSQSSNFDDWRQYPGAPAHQGQGQYQAHDPNQPPPQWNNSQFPQSFNMSGGPPPIPPQSQWQPPPQFDQHSQWQQAPPQYGQQDSWQQPYQQPPFGGAQQSSFNQQSQPPPQQPPPFGAEQHPPFSQPHHQQQSQPSVDQGQPQSTSQANPQPTPAQPQQQPSSVPGGLPGLPDFDPAKTIQQIYPILAFRDKVVRTISAIIEKIPGLEALVDRITETLTVFVLSLLAPFVRPVLKALEKSLQAGSTGVVESSAQHQFEPWTDPHCTNPTHSMLSKDHFSNVLNEPAGHVAAEVVKFIAPRVLYAWQHPNVPIDQIMSDVEKIFHHPAFRDMNIEIHRNMFNAVERWQKAYRGPPLGEVLSSDGVKNGKNQKASAPHQGHSHGQLPGVSQFTGQTQHQQQQQPQGGHGMHFNVGGFDVGNMASQALGGGGGRGGGQQQQQQHQGGSGNVGQYLNMASKIPGMQGIGRYSKYANMLGGSGGHGGGSGGLASFLGGSRGVDGLDEDEVGGVAGTQGVMGGEIGGGREMADAVSGLSTATAEEMRENAGGSAGWEEMRAPAGYEQYGS